MSFGDELERERERVARLVRHASVSWADAMRAHKLAPPDEGFAARLQRLSEATQRLPDDLKKKHPEINWRAITGFRNILVHDYLADHIDIETIVDVIENDLPDLHRAVKKMLANKK